MSEMLGIELHADSPLGSFIHEHVEPRAEDFNTFDRVKTHGGLLREAGRGRKLRSRAVGNNYAFLAQHATVGGMGEIVTSLVSDLALHISSSRTLTRQALIEASLPAPRASAFPRSARQDAQQFLKSSTHPMVLQRDFSRLLNAPLHPLKESSFTRSWETTTQRDDDVLFLAETPPGLVLRAFVVREEAVSALVCVPFYVIGDGEKTLQELIDDKVRLRRRHAFLAERVPFRNAAPTATDTVSQLREVLPPGVIRALGRSVNPFHEGIPVDVTDLISPHLKELAVDAAWAVPGLTAGAVDIITPQLESSDETLVMGLDATARLELHHYPALGKPRPVAEMMMSAMVRRDH